ncbi:MAG: FadR/GntR family transcriptional regulator [Hyphomicrobiales bacterium]
METPLTHLAIGRLREFIAQPQWRDGGKLPPETVLAREIGVSRPVLRQAIGILKGDRLIESRRGSGNFVCPARSVEPAVFRRPQTLHDLEHCFRFRAVIESAAAAEAARHGDGKLIAEIESSCLQMEQTQMHDQSVFDADFRFHSAVAKASGNHYFALTLELLRPQMEVAYRLTRQLRHVPVNVTSHRVAAEHRQILKAIHAGDAELSHAKMLDHVHAGLSRLFGA